ASYVNYNDNDNTKIKTLREITRVSATIQRQLRFSIWNSHTFPFILRHLSFFFSQQRHLVTKKRNPSSLALQQNVIFTFISSPSPSFLLRICDFDALRSRLKFISSRTQRLFSYVNRLVFT
ncbi:unnamed protein product, partial [Amoebophrya sp. A25]